MVRASTISDPGASPAASGAGVWRVLYSTSIVTGPSILYGEMVASFAIAARVRSRIRSRAAVAESDSQA